MRLGKITASASQPLMAARGLGKTARTYALQLIAEKLTQMPEETPVTYAMQQGIELEPEAREQYAKAMNIEVKECGGIEVPELNLWASPDGVCGEDGLLEIKAPQPKKHVDYIVSGPGEAMHQLQFLLFISGRKWIDFISYNPDFPAEYAMYIERIEPDEQWQKTFMERLGQFNKLMEMMEGKL
jgi:hypothetical protein